MAWESPTDLAWNSIGAGGHVPARCTSNDRNGYRHGVAGLRGNGSQAGVREREAVPRVFQPRWSEPDPGTGHGRPFRPHGLRCDLTLRCGSEEHLHLRSKMR